MIEVNNSDEIRTAILNLSSVTITILNFQMPNEAISGHARHQQVSEDEDEVIREAISIFAS